jgi:hypothetical protein
MYRILYFYGWPISVEKTTTIPNLLAGVVGAYVNIIVPSIYNFGFIVSEMRRLDVLNLGSPSF